MKLSPQALHSCGIVLLSYVILYKIQNLLYSTVIKVKILQAQGS